MKEIAVLVLMASGPLDYGPTEIPCANASLWSLATLKNREIPVELINKALRGSPADGASISELISASGTFGLRLTARRLGEREALPGEPCIALLQPFGSNRPGHYVTVRRVGPDSARIQIIDFPAEPSVVDEWDWRVNSSFSGWVIYESRTWISETALGVALICTGAAIFAAGRWRARRLPRSPNKKSDSVMVTT